MRCARHDLAMAPDGTCVRCRREGVETAGAEPTARGPGIAALVVLGFVVASALAFALRPRAAPTSPPASRIVASTPPTASAPPLAALDPALVPADPTAAPAPAGEQTPLERAMHEAKIELYCRTAPPECAQARTWLLGHGYLYKEHNLDGDVAAERALRKLLPDATVPAFDIDGQAFAGFEPARIQGALEYAGARRLQR